MDAILTEIFRHNPKVGIGLGAISYRVHSLAYI
jgi:hypothetical protein